MRLPTIIVSIAMAIGLLATPRGSGAGPAKKPANKPSQPKPSEAIAREGKIRIVRGLQGGAEPQLTDSRDKRWLLIGPSRPELRRLGGHRVKVWGVVSDKKVVHASLKVRRYEILDSGGKKPAVGLLRIGPDKDLQLRLKDATMLTVKAKKALLRRLKRRVGCKVWLVGEIEGDTIKAYKFGWLSCQKTKPIKPQEKETRQ